MKTTEPAAATGSAQYALTEEQVALRDMVRELAREKVAPGAMERDHSKSYPSDMFELLRERGLLTLPFPEDYGDSGRSLLSCLLVIEELTKVDYNTSYLLMNTWQPFFVIMDAGSEAQRRRYLPDLAAGKTRFGTAATEPGVGSDLAGIATRAERVDGGYVLNGAKAWCSNAPIADYVIVFAKTEPAAGARGISTFVVPRETRGMTIGPLEDKIGGRAIPTASEILFENAYVPEEARLGPEGKGFFTASSTFIRLRPLVGGRALGLAQGALDLAVAYARERRAFGRPIGEFQGLQWMLADMAIETEAARQLVYRSAAVLDSGVSPRDASPIVAMAKCFATDVAMKVAVDAAQVFGRHGCTYAHPIERYMREAKILQVLEGTNQIQRNIVARSLLGDLRRPRSQPAVESPGGPG